MFMLKPHLPRFVETKLKLLRRRSIGDPLVLTLFVMFLHLSVSHSVHRGVCPIACWDTPLGRHPLADTLQADTPPGQTAPLHTCNK